MKGVQKGSEVLKRFARFEAESDWEQPECKTIVEDAEGYYVRSDDVENVLKGMLLVPEEKWLSTQNIVGMIVKQMDKIKWDTKGKKLPIQLWYEDLKDLVEELERMVNEK